MTTAPVSTTRGDAGDSSAGAGSTGEWGLGTVVLRPRPTLVRSIGLPVLALALPLLITVAWVLRPIGGAAVVAAAVASLVLLGLSVLAWYRYRRTEIRVGPQGVGERGFFGRVHAFPRERIAEVLRLETYRGDTLETVRQLFVVDAEGRCLVRMRGTFWDDASMDLVAPTLDVPESVRNEPVTLSELRASNPGLLFWFEGRGLPRG